MQLSVKRVLGLGRFFHTRQLRYASYGKHRPLPSTAKLGSALHNVLSLAKFLEHNKGRISGWLEIQLLLLSELSLMFTNILNLILL